MARSFIYFGNPPVAVPTLASLVTQLSLSALVSRPVTEPPIDPPAGGGTVPTGTNPAAGTAISGSSSTQVYRVWMEIEVGGDTPTTLSFAKEAINATVRKTPNVQSFGTVIRALTNESGGFEVARVVSVLDDWDDQLASLYYSGVVLNQIVRYFIATIATIQAGGTPWRIFAGIVRSFTPNGDGTFTLECEDALTTAKGVLAQERLVPQELYGTRPITDSNPRDYLADKPVPHVYGLLTDDVGRVPAIYIQQYSGWQPELPRSVDVFLVAASCISNIAEVFGADYVTAADTEPTERAQIPDSFWGTEGWHPFHPSWTFPDKWVEYPAGEPDRRYTVIAIRQTCPVAILAKEGRIPITLNVGGEETVGNGLGSAINNPAFLLQHILNTRCLQESNTDHPPVLDLDGYSALDTDSFGTVAAYMDSLALEAAGVLGDGGQQVLTREIIADFCLTFGFDFCVNRHGQGRLVVLDRSNAAYVREYNDVSHIPDGALSFSEMEVFNEATYGFGKNYIGNLPELSPEAIPEQEQARLPTDPLNGEWKSGLRTLPNETSIDAMGGRPHGLVQSPFMALRWLEEEASAELVMQNLLDLHSGPTPRLEITIPIRFMDGGLDDELGTVLLIRHRHLPGSPRRCQLRRIAANLDDFWADLTVRDVDDLLP